LWRVRPAAYSIWTRHRPQARFRARAAVPQAAGVGSNKYIAYSGGPTARARFSRGDQVEARKCKRCGEEKKPEEFVVNKSAASGGNICRECRRKRDAERRSANRDEFRAKHSEWRDANREHVRQYHKRKRDELRDEVLDAYGGKCACCGEVERDFLTIDHINGGGTAHRKAIHGKVYNQLRRDGFPLGYRVLCWNCNWAHRLYGSCPHQSGQQRLLHLAPRAA